MRRRMVGIRAKVAAVSAAEVIAIGAVIMLPLWWAVGTAAAAALMLAVTVHGRSAPGWAAAAVRWRGARRATLTVPGAVDIAVGDTVCGVRVEGGQAVSMISLAGRPHRPTYLRNSGVAVTDDVVPLRILADQLVQPGGLHLSIDVVSVGRRVRRTGGYPALYSTLLGARPAIGARDTVLVIRLQIPQSSTGLGYRGSVGAALAAATERIVNALRQGGVRATTHDAADLDAALTELGRGLLDDTRDGLGWRSVKTRDGYAATYYLSPADITTATLNRLWALHVDAVTVTVSLQNIGGQPTVSAMVQVVTPQPPTEAPTLDVNPLPGDQLAALRWSAPTAKPCLTIPTARLGDPDALRLPVGPVGVLLGAAAADSPASGRRDDFVMLPLTDPVDTTRIAMDVDPGYARTLLMRAAAVGERILIHTNTPDAWAGLVGPNIAVAEAGRGPFVPTIIVNDHAVTPPGHGLAATMITLGGGDADIHLTQVDGSTVHVETGTTSLDVGVITFLREEGWTG